MVLKEVVVPAIKGKKMENMRFYEFLNDCLKLLCKELLVMIQNFSEILVLVYDVVNLWYRRGHKICSTSRDYN
jgi:hypothetical protein